MQLKLYLYAEKKNLNFMNRLFGDFFIEYFLTSVDWQQLKSEKVKLWMEWN